MMNPISVNLYIFVTLLGCVAVSGQLTLSVTDTCKYVINVASTPWLQSGDVYFQASGMHHSTSDDTLKLTATEQISGKDAFGAYNKNIFYWLAGNVKVQTVIKQYKYEPAAIFSQVFPDGVPGTSVGDMHGVVSGFPTLQMDSKVQLGWMTYHGVFIGWTNTKYGRWTSSANIPGGMESGPLLVFDGADNVLVVSPFSQFMAASYSQRNSSLAWGIMGDAESIPAGFQYDTVIYYGDRGINQAMSGWGRFMQRWYKRVPSARYLDPSNRYVGYYTDNGAYYYNVKEPGLDYEQTIQSIVKYYHLQNIPYRYIQLDDWWYPITGSGYGATVTWTADPEVFPHGLQYVYNMTQLPVVAHNRYWSNTTPYAKQNGGRYNFLMDGEMSLPDDQTFWDNLMMNGKKWGLTVYEQDWLNEQVEVFGPLHKDVSLGRRWLQQMGEAAGRFGVYVQYCMALPRHALAALEVPAVSQIRASIDYHLDARQWTVGVTSMLAEALGLAPFKDNFWTTRVQPGNKYNKTEENPLLQAVVALLTTGPVGVGDRVGYSDQELIKRLVNADGLLLKPSKPATAIDAQIKQAAFGGQVGPVGEVWSTVCSISATQFGLVLCPEITNTYLVTPRDIRLNDGFYGIYSYTFDADHDDVRLFSSKSPLKLSGCSYKQFCLYYVTPAYTFSSKVLFILGELSKLVPMSPDRVVSIDFSTRDLQIQLQGKPAETVNFYFSYDGKNAKIVCVINDLGNAVISWAARRCY